MISISHWGFALALVFIFFAGIIAERLRKDLAKMQATADAYKIGYRIGFQTAELKFAPSHPEPEDFENLSPSYGHKDWPPLSSFVHICPAEFQRDGETFNFPRSNVPEELWERCKCGNIRKVP